MLLIFGRNGTPYQLLFLALKTFNEKNKVSYSATVLIVIISLAHIALAKHF